MVLWKLLRKMARILRGEALPFQIVTAVTLGVLGGFMMGANLIFVLLLLLMLVLNLNLGLFLISLALGKSFAIILAPLTFRLGVWLLDIGPVQAIVRKLVNSPVTALMDLERYVVLGGLFAGLVMGVALGAVAARAIDAFRRKMLSLEEGSEAWAKFNRNIITRFAKRLLFGKAKGGQRESAKGERKVPVLRPKGAIVLVAGILLMAAATYFLLPSVLRAGIERGLGWANGAEVNLGDLELSFVSGRLFLHDFQMTDARHPERNLIEFGELGAAVSVRDLLRKRVVIREALVARARLDAKRGTPGRVFVEAAPEKAPAPTDIARTKPEETPGKSPQDYFKKGERIVERLKQIDYYLDRLEGLRNRRKKDRSEKAEQGAQRPPYADMRAAFLIEQAPRVVVEHLAIEEVTPPATGISGLTAEIENLTSDPELSGRPTMLTLSQKETARRAVVTFNLHREGMPHGLELSLPDIPMEALNGELSENAAIQLKQGTASLACSGTFSKERLDLPLAVMLRGLVAEPKQGEDSKGFGARLTTKALKALSDTQMIITVYGSLTSPRVKFNVAEAKGKVTDALTDAVREETEGLLEEKAEELLETKVGEEATDELKGRLGRWLRRDDEEEEEEKTDDE